MPDRRKRFRSKKLDERVPNGQVILARRQPSSSSSNDAAVGNDRQQQQQQQIQPKILLKQRTPEQGGFIATTTSSSSGSGGGVGAANRSEEPISRYQQHIRTTIIQRSNASSGSSLQSGLSAATSGGSSGSLMGATTNSDNKDIPAAATTTTYKAPTTETQIANAQTVGAGELLELTKQHMRHPVVLITSAGLPNYNVRKVLCKSNNDFLVVGVLGAHGVGKSTVMNLLAYDHYLQAEYSKSSSYTSSSGGGGDSVSLCPDFERLFLHSDKVFNTKIRNSATRARTESIHMYVTGERMILIDTPPLFCNTHKREIAHNDLDELRMSINLLHICHLLIIVYEHTLSLDEVRLLHMALHMKALKLSKTHTENYLPRLLFVKNRASRIDYTPEMQQRTNNLIWQLFRDTDLDITRSGRSSSAGVNTKVQQPQIKETTTKAATATPAAAAPAPAINSFLLPEFKSADATITHASLAELTSALRQRVLATSRNKMVESNANDYNEYEWFETVIKATQDGMQQLDETYESVMLQHLELNDASTTNATGTRSGSAAHCGNQSNVDTSSAGVAGAVGSGIAGRNNERFKERRAYRVMAKP